MLNFTLPVTEAARGANVWTTISWAPVINFISATLGPLVAPFIFAHFLRRYRVHILAILICFALAWIIVKFTNKVLDRRESVINNTYNIGQLQHLTILDGSGRVLKKANGIPAKLNVQGRIEEATASPDGQAGSTPRLISRGEAAKSRMPAGRKSIQAEKLLANNTWSG